MLDGNLSLTAAIFQIDKDLVSEVSKDLRETNDKIGEFVERKVTAEDQLRRIDIRAPQDGVVLQSTVHTVGGVITADQLQLTGKTASSLEKSQSTRSIAITGLAYHPHKDIVVTVSVELVDAPLQVRNAARSRAARRVLRQGWPRGPSRVHLRGDPRRQHVPGTLRFNPRYRGRPLRRL
mgnify:CR=1 FL=1